MGTVGMISTICVHSFSQHWVHRFELSKNGRRGIAHFQTLFLKKYTLELDIGKMEQAEGGSFYNSIHKASDTKMCFEVPQLRSPILAQKVFGAAQEEDDGEEDYLFEKE